MPARRRSRWGAGTGAAALPEHLECARGTLPNAHQQRLDRAAVGILAQGGELQVKIGASQYNDNQVRGALIKTVAAETRRAITARNYYEAK
ncbi:hypothetical protein PG996_007431 [Apiospora saccharicola]|uniref:Uncharacterized protein n=1 Tax=Apiospora saccharicola TaxID=335842 RepID=A0ABR1VAT3_9PEZI